MAERFFSARGLCAGYGDIQVLWDIDIAVPEGEITCIVGSNGTEVSSKRPRPSCTGSAIN